MASFDEVVPPGKVGSIKASVHTANYKGTIGKSVTVTHDDKTQGPIILSVAAKIVGSVEVFPYPALQLDRRFRGFSTPAKLIVRKDATEEGTLAFDGLAASAPWLKVSSRRVTSDEPAVEGLPAALAGDIVVSAQVDSPPVGTRMESLTFKTGLKREPLVTIPVTVAVEPAVTLQPNDLILNPSPDGEDGASGQVLAAVREDLDPKTVVFSSDAGAFSVRADPSGERAFRLIVDWAGKEKQAPTQTTIHVRVGAENVDLPVRVNLTRVLKSS